MTLGEPKQRMTATLILGSARCACNTRAHPRSSELDSIILTLDLDTLNNDEVRPGRYGPAIEYRYTGWCLGALIFLNDLMDRRRPRAITPVIRAPGRVVRTVQYDQRYGSAVDNFLYCSSTSVFLPWLNGTILRCTKTQSQFRQVHACAVI